MTYFKIKKGGAVDWIFFLGLLLVVGIYVFVPKTVEAAYFQILPSTGTYYGGENFEVSILVNSDMAINAVSGVLTFPTRHLKIIEINKKNSIINFWVEEPSFSNSGEIGNVRFEGIILNPGFTGNGGKIVNIVFRVDGKGAADVDFFQSAILANDGQGTNIVNSNVGAKFIFIPQRIVSTQEQVSKEPNQLPTIILKEFPSTGNFSGILSFWNVLPNWIKASVLISIGITTILFSFIILSLGVLILIWFWSNVWHRRDQFFALLSLIVHKIKSFIFKILNFLGITEREIKRDIQYNFHQFIREFTNVSQTHSFKNLIENYFFLIRNIAKRFFTKNTFIEDPSKKK